MTTPPPAQPTAQPGAKTPQQVDSIQDRMLHDDFDAEDFAEIRRLRDEMKAESAAGKGPQQVSENAAELADDVAILKQLRERRHDD